VVAFLAVASPVVSIAGAQAPASIINATTGLSDAAGVAPVAACAPPSSERATCLAQILGVRGTKTLVHPRLRQPSSIYRFTRPRGRHSHAATAVVPAAAAPQPGTPAYLQQAYDLAYLAGNEGSGETIALVDAFDDPNAESDLAAYRAEFGLPACTTANGCFAKYDQNGGTNYPTGAGYTQTDIEGWQLEISLDLDAVSALCPNCNIDLIEANSAATSDLAAAQLTAGTLPGVSVISDSWDVDLTGSQAHSFPKSGDYTFSGITTVAAAGDSGYGYPTSSYNYFPAALPGVTAAGGTTLQPDSTSGVQNVRGFTEAAWSGTGSGCNLAASQPAYQADINSGCTGRAYSDISADADPDTGMQVYDSNQPYGGWVVAGGTSEASPLIAAYYALVGAAAQGPSWAYANAALLNDPSSGSNGSCSASIFDICNAGPGYDGPTGVGSISGAVTSGAPGIAGPGTSGSYAQTVTANSAQLRGGVYPNGFDTTYWWEYGTTTAYGQTTTANDIGSGTAPVAVTDTLSGLSPGTTYHYRLVAQNSVGTPNSVVTEYGYDYTFTTPASTTSSSGGGSNQSSTTTTSTPPPTTTSSPPVTGSGGSGGTGTGTSPVSAPAVANVRVGAAATSATVSATIATGGAATTSTLQYGTTRSLGKSLPGSRSSQTATASWTLRNLSPGKVYYLRVVASNAAGGSAGTVVRFRTSPVTIAGVSTRGNALKVVLRCHGSASCHVRIQGRSGTRVLLSSQATIHGNRSTTVTLRLSKSFETLATRHRNATVLVLSTWNRSTATVSTTV